MGISIYNNIAAAKTANELSSHYRDLATSTRRLSSGLRINGAADDAAGLAIRELQRADIAALHQGVRNVNDAISMLQTFDGALSVIDEKLIRMKELAEQAATGTYDSTQRLMIDSEFQAMGSEINRIANATDFNGVKLLCTKMMTWYTNKDKFVTTSSVDKLTLSGGQNAKISEAINVGKYINDNDTQHTISVLLSAKEKTDSKTGDLVLGRQYTSSDGGLVTEYALKGADFSVAYVDGLGEVEDPVIKYDASVSGTDPATKWSMSDKTHTSYDIDPISPGDTQIGGYAPRPTRSVIDFSMNDEKGRPIDFSSFGTDYPQITNINIDTGANTYKIDSKIVALDDIPAAADYTASYDEANQTITVNLKNGGGSVTMKLDNPLDAGDTISFDINMEGEVKNVPVEHHGPDPDQKVKIHFGTLNDSAEDYYYIQFNNATLEGLGLDGVDIQTQEKAQNALVQIKDAIVVKDKIRADYGALQNRFENTATNLTVQAENLQASESRISDADVAYEMMTFVRNQVLTQAAVAMLSQANSMPQMVMRLIGA